MSVGIGADVAQVSAGRNQLCANHRWPGRQLVHTTLTIDSWPVKSNQHGASTCSLILRWRIYPPVQRAQRHTQKFRCLGFGDDLLSEGARAEALEA